MWPLARVPSETDESDPQSKANSLNFVYFSLSLSFILFFLSLSCYCCVLFPPLCVLGYPSVSPRSRLAPFIKDERTPNITNQITFPVDVERDRASHSARTPLIPHQLHKMHIRVSIYYVNFKPSRLRGLFYRP